MRFFSIILIGYFGAIDGENLKCYQCTEEDVGGDVDCFEGEINNLYENRAAKCDSCVVDRMVHYYTNGSELWEITRGCSKQNPRGYDVRTKFRL